MNAAGVLWALLGAAVGAGAAAWYFRRRERMRARFLSFVAHEINSPVTSLNMTVLNFLSGLFGPVSDEHRPWLVLLREQTSRLAALVGDLRDLVHSEFHRDLRLSTETVELEPLIKSCLESMEDTLARSKAKVELGLPDDLPSVEADPDRVFRVFTGIFTHARKFRMDGGIKVTGRAANDEVGITTEYVGMKAEEKDYRQVLDLYYPVRVPESQVLAGVGLGLGLPCRLVRAHGGEMKIRVDRDGRCCITVWLPRSGGSAADREGSGG